MGLQFTHSPVILIKRSLELRLRVLVAEDTLPPPTLDDPAWRFGAQEAYKHVGDASTEVIKST
jgi:hypothetical protein